MSAVGAPSLSQLWRALRLCRWPPLTLAGRCLTGEADWAQTLPRLTPRERGALLGRLGRRELLVRTPGGRWRLRRWLDRQWARPEAMEPPEALRTRVERDLHAYGDPTMIPIIVDVLCTLPDAVRTIVGEESVWLAAGRAVRGWTSPPLETTQRCPIFIAGSDPAAIAETTRHEVAHRWNAAPITMDMVTPTVPRAQALVAHAVAEGWPVAEAARRADEDETLAELLAHAWAFGASAEGAR